jgi:hypothetical protein
MLESTNYKKTVSTFLRKVNVMWTYKCTGIENGTGKKCFQSWADVDVEEMWMLMSRKGEELRERP